MKQRLYQRLVRDEKLRDVMVSLSHAHNYTGVIKDFSEAMMSINNKHNYKTLIKSPPAFCWIALKPF